jgi:hypothetical protein
MIMNKNNIDNFTGAFGLSLIAASFLNAALLILKEKNEAVMGAMKQAMGHHWITHGTIVIVLFIVLGFVFAAMKLGTKIDDKQMLRYIIWGTIISGLIIAGYFFSNLQIAPAIKY